MNIRETLEKIEYETLMPRAAKSAHWPDSAVRLRQLFPDGVPPGSPPSALIRGDRKARS